MLLVVLLLTGCKKDVDEGPGTLQNKWNLVSYITNSHFANADHNDVITGKSGDYMDFQADGKLAVRILSQDYVSIYKTTGTNVILDGTDEYVIVKLTGKQLVLSQKTFISSQDYTEKTFKLSR
jgi:lipopolysaccharide export system protein LptA